MCITHQMQRPAEEMLILAGAITVEIAPLQLATTAGTRPLTDGDWHGVDDENAPFSQHLSKRFQHQCQHRFECVQTPIEVRNTEASDVPGLM